MKAVVLWAFLLGIVRCEDYNDEFKCAATPKSIKFTLKSYRNQTGHWNAQVQMEHTDVEEDDAAWEVDIHHKYAPRCDGSGTVFLLATITVPSKGSAAVKQPLQKSIPAGYRKFSERSYFSAHSEQSTWVGAQDICEKEGAHLAVINSEAEAKFIASIWNSSADYIFIGTHDLFVEGKFVTIYSQTLRDAGYDMWSKGEPDGGTQQNCGVVFRNGLLGNSICSMNLPFLCELNY